MIKIDLSEIRSVINPAFHWLMDDTHRNVVLRGGAGSGKSYSVVQILLYHILSTLDKPNAHRFLLLRKTGPAARKSIYPLLEHLIEEWNLKTIVSINATQGVFRFINGSEILISSLDDPEKIKSLYGVDKVLMEEAFEFTLDDYRQLSLRLRGDKTKTYQIFMLFNPITSFSWIYNEFFAKDRQNTIKHHSTYKDNKYLDDEYKRQLEDLVNQDENFANIYLRGEFGFTGSTVYQNYKIVDNYPEVVGEEVFGLDLGYTHPTALVRCGITKEGIYIKEELYMSGLTNTSLIDKLHTIVKNNTRIYCDSALPGNIQEIRLAGLNIIPADKRPHSVLQGINFIKRQKLLVTKDSTNIIKELNTYCFKTDKDGTLREEPIKMFDDALDAMRYAIYTHLFNKVNYKIVVPK